MLAGNPGLASLEQSKSFAPRFFPSNISLDFVLVHLALSFLGGANQSWFLVLYSNVCLFSFILCVDAKAGIELGVVQ